MGPKSKKHKSDKDRPEKSSARRSEKESHNEKTSSRTSSKRKRDEKSSAELEEKTRKIHKTEREIKVTASGEDPASVQATAEISLSITETNKLREQLGLPPLQTDDEPKEKIVEGEEGPEKVYTKDGVEFVHRAPKNWSDTKKEEKMRDKLETSKQRRKYVDKLGTVKLLAADEENDSALSWIEKSRKIEQEKKLAEQRAKILEEMDNDFGVGNIISDHVKDHKSKAYTSKDLRGLTVKHSLEHLVGHESETILVLEDKDVLDSTAEEVLINPTLQLHEKWTKNADLRKKKPGYDPFQDDFDEFGKFQEKTLLGKYDEEIEGEKNESFRIGAKGHIDAEREMALADKLKSKLKEGYQSLELAESKLATEFYTKEEMSKFKKPKKKVKRIRGRITVAEEIEASLKADDLLENGTRAKPSQDYGSRAGKWGVVKEENGESDVADQSVIEARPPPESQAAPSKPVVDVSGLKIDSEEESEDEFVDDLAGVIIEDEADNELQSVLHRTRIIKQLELKSETPAPASEQVADLVSRAIKQEPEQLLEENGTSGEIVLNTVSEYCKNLGDVRTYDRAGNIMDAGENSDDEDRQSRMSFSASDEDKPTTSGRWIKAKFEHGSDSEVDVSADENEEEVPRPPILDEEPVVGSGVAAALKMAQRKGYLEPAEITDHGPSRLAHLEAQRYTILDKQFHDIDDKYAKKLERMGGHGGPVMDFKEKTNYEPKSKIEHFDKNGNVLDPKEAFRHLSWKFHGKAPGKKKTERRINKLTESRMVNRMSSMDTPLGTLGKQMEKQKLLSTPYIVLSGTGSKDVVAQIKKE